MGIGTAGFGGTGEHPEVGPAVEVVREALPRGLPYFDTAPVYSNGRAETTLGFALRELGHPDVIVSTKVGRLLDDSAQGWRFDYSRDGVLASVDASLERLGVDHVDMLLVHDPDGHEREALDTAFPTLIELRDAGVVRAVGVGMNQASMPARFAREVDLDLVLVAGRFNLLDATARRELLPLCSQRGIAVVVGGVFKSGLLAAPDDPAVTFDYVAPPPEVRERARAIRTVAQRHGVTLAQLAVAFVRREQAVTSVLLGIRTTSELAENVIAMQREIPLALWAELETADLLPR